MIDQLLLSVARVSTFLGDQLLTQATGFFFEDQGQLFLITNHHVVCNDLSNHHPDRLELDLHIDPENVAATQSVNVPLFEQGHPLWRETSDSGGPVDIAAIPLKRELLPNESAVARFLPESIVTNYDDYEVGAPLSIVGFPLGFQDELHHLPVARQASVSSAFGLRFQGQGCFLTDARMHRGASGSPVVARIVDESHPQGGVKAAGTAAEKTLPWRLLGVHASRFDMGTRDPQADESLGLNAAWYADAILKLTRQDPPSAADGMSSSPAQAGNGQTAPAASAKGRIETPENLSAGDTSSVRNRLSNGPAGDRRDVAKSVSAAW